MPWEVYLDWLEDQGYGDLREIDFSSLVSGEFNWQHYTFYFDDYSGEGYSGYFTDGETLVRDWDNQGVVIFSGYGGDVHLRDSGCHWSAEEGQGAGYPFSTDETTGHGFCGRVEISNYDRALL